MTIAGGTMLPQLGGGLVKYDSSVITSLTTGWFVFNNIGAVDGTVQPSITAFRIAPRAGTLRRIGVHLGNGSSGSVTFRLGVGPVGTVAVVSSVAGTVTTGGITLEFDSLARFNAGDAVALGYTGAVSNQRFVVWADWVLGGIQ